MRNRLSAFASFRRCLTACALVVVAIVLGSFLLPSATFAQTGSAVGNAQAVTQAAGVTGQQDLITIIGRIINIFLGFLGIIFVILMLYAGYLYMTAAGDPEKVKKAVGTIRNAIIGLVIIASAWAITAFVLSFFTGQGPSLGSIIGTPAPAPGGLLGSSGSLGSGIIEYVLPEPNATDVARNSPIIIQFKQPIYPGSFIKGWTDATSATVNGLNDDDVKIYRVDGGVQTALGSDQARVFYTQDLKNFVIRPVQYLGSPSTKVTYTVKLAGGSAGIQTAATGAGGTHPAAFTGSFADGYQWQFETGTTVDLTPPVVTATVPPSTGQYARNIVIQLNFSKPMDPTTISGKNAFIQVLSGTGGAPATTIVPGSFTVTDHFLAAEFVADDMCGGMKNSCGVNIHCLPPAAEIVVTAKAATVDAKAPPQAILTNNGYDGVVSAVGNSLDGNKNGQGDGPPGDDYSWSFGTSDQIQIAPPVIESTDPPTDPMSGADSNIALDKPFVANFNTFLQSSTINTDTARIDAHGRDETDPDKFWYTASVKLLNADGSDFDPGAQPPTLPAKAAVVLTHRLFLPSGIGVKNLNYYDPYLTSGIQDAYQNCFNPAAACGPAGGVGNPNCCRNQPTAQGCAAILKTP